MRTKGLGPQGLGIAGNNGYHIGSPNKMVPVAAAAAGGGAAAGASGAAAGAGAGAGAGAAGAGGSGLGSILSGAGGGGGKKTTTSKSSGDPGASMNAPSAMKKKDACYKKAKAKYDVFPSAYASGYIAKCRKRGGKLG
tara:strand:- start:477 stop:890 length:414 start_codon:yes stop_codon:yes gene_type:complete